MKVKLPFKAHAPGQKKPKMYNPGDDATGPDAEIGIRLGCIDPPQPRPAAPAPTPPKDGTKSGGGK